MVTAYIIAEFNSPGTIPYLSETLLSNLAKRIIQIVIIFTAHDSPIPEYDRLTKGEDAFGQFSPVSGRARILKPSHTFFDWHKVIEFFTLYHASQALIGKHIHPKVFGKPFNFRQ